MEFLTGCAHQTTLLRLEKIYQCSCSPQSHWSRRCRAGLRGGCNLKTHTRAPCAPWLIISGLIPQGLYFKSAPKLMFFPALYPTLWADWGLSFCPTFPALFSAKMRLLVPISSSPLGSMTAGNLSQTKLSSSGGNNGDSNALCSNEGEGRGQPLCGIFHA